MQPQIKEVFEIIKALPGVNIFKDLAEFDAYIAARQRTHEHREQGKTEAHMHNLRPGALRGHTSP
jgi:hypothetical protein